MAELKVEKKATDRGVVVKNPLPDDPENIRLSKAQFVAKERKRREDELKVAEFRKTLQQDKPAEGTGTNASENKKTRGRPKKIE